MNSANVNFQRKLVNQVLVRCKNGKHQDHRSKLRAKAEKKLSKFD